MTDPITLLQDLIRCKSVTPVEGGALDYIENLLKTNGFDCHRLTFTDHHTPDVDNLYARFGTGAPHFCFAGHTDVVPTGDAGLWSCDPFGAEIKDGYVWGRGAADMKGSIASFIAAALDFIKTQKFQGSISFLLTGDEEGPAINGTKKVLEWLEARGEKIDFCLVGEPTSRETLGDMMKIGRRGTFTGKLAVTGVQGHVAYPHRADNPIHRLAPALAELAAEQWDNGNAFFPATSFQVSNINAGTGADNVIPGEAKVVFNFRFSTEVTDAQLRERTQAILDRHGLRYDLNWRLSGQPFLTAAGELVDAAVGAIREVVGIETRLSTEGGTSDGRFIAPTGAQVVELGPVNATIHKVNEEVSAADLDTLTIIYERMLVRLLAS